MAFEEGHADTTQGGTRSRDCRAHPRRHLGAALARATAAREQYDQLREHDSSAALEAERQAQAAYTGGQIGLPALDPGAANWRATPGSAVLGRARLSARARRSRARDWSEPSNERPSRLCADAARCVASGLAASCQRHARRADRDRRRRCPSSSKPPRFEPFVAMIVASGRRDARARRRADGDRARGRRASPRCRSRRRRRQGRRPARAVRHSDARLRRRRRNARPSRRHPRGSRPPRRISHRLSGLLAQGVAAPREVEDAKRQQAEAEADLEQAQSAVDAAVVARRLDPSCARRSQASSPSASTTPAISSSRRPAIRCCASSIRRNCRSLRPCRSPTSRAWSSATPP